MPPRSQKRRAPAQEPSTPYILDGHECRDIDDIEWPAEAVGPDSQHAAGTDVTFLRTANWFAFVRPGTSIMAPLSDWDRWNGLDLLCWCASLSGGLRRATRAYIGFTPLWSHQANQGVWKMQCELVRVGDLQFPKKERVKIMGAMRPLAVWVDTLDKSASYMLQSPDLHYEAHWARALAEYRLVEFQPPNLAAPAPPKLNMWAVAMCRLEQGIPAHHKDDPKRSLTMTPNGLAMVSEETLSTWDGDQRRLELNQGDDEDDGGDISDAASLVSHPDNSNHRTPTGRKWKHPRRARLQPGETDNARFLTTSDEEDVTRNEGTGVDEPHGTGQDDDDDLGDEDGVGEPDYDVRTNSRSRSGSRSMPTPGQAGIVPRRSTSRARSTVEVELIPRRRSTSRLTPTAHSRTPSASASGTTVHRAGPTRADEEMAPPPAPAPAPTPTPAPALQPAPAPGPAQYVVAPISAANSTGIVLPDLPNRRAGGHRWNSDIYVINRM